MSYTPLTELRMKYKRQEGNPRAPIRRADLVLPGVNLGTVQGRRYKAIVCELVAEYGKTDITRLRELAVLRVALEQTQSEVVNGNAAAREAMVRISNLASRKESELRARMATAPIDRRPLHERIMGAGPAGKDATATKASKGRDMAAGRIERMAASRRQATNAIEDDGGGG
jgi:hypothetical protein